jgi:hypothetical protein
MICLCAIACRTELRKMADPKNLSERSPLQTGKRP